jgi:hypothetical protein
MVNATLVNEPAFAIGQKFMTRGKHPRFCQVIDILRTFNHAGELVKITYVANHACMGQIVTDYDVCETTIRMGIITR